MARSGEMIRGEIAVATTHDAGTGTGTGNWGRWGSDDERGTLNLITPEAVLAATKVCKTGKVYSLALPIQREGVPIFDYRGAPQRLTLTSASDADMYKMYGAVPGVGANEDILVLASHSITHMDALSHVFADDHMYNGFPSGDFTTNAGAAHLDISKTGSFAGRGVMLDLPKHQGVDWLEPGQVIDSAQLEACRAAQGVELRSGDILVVRTGWLDFYATGQADFAQPGLGKDAVTFVDDHQVAVVGADNAAIESIPFDDNEFLAVHIELLVKRGVTLLEHLYLADLAADGCTEFFLSVGGLKVTGAAGSPINPIAIG
jgi:kynurenine formamidase